MKRLPIFTVLKFLLSLPSFILYQVSSPGLQISPTNLRVVLLINNMLKRDTTKESVTMATGHEDLNFQKGVSRRSRASRVALFLAALRIIELVCNIDEPTCSDSKFSTGSN
jgi:hypothetical protein